MSCVQRPPTFRLLDGLVGWDVDPAALPGAALGLVGLDDESGVRLAPTSAAAVDPGAVLDRLAPPRLARSCHPCTWYLATPAPSRLLVRGPCDEDWRPAWPRGLDPRLFDDAVAIAADARFLAVADGGARRVWIFSRRSLRVVCALTLVPPRRPVALALAPWGEVLVATDRPSILRFGLSGELRGELALPAAVGAVDRIAVEGDGSIWLVARRDAATLSLWRAPLLPPDDAPCGDPVRAPFAGATVDALAAAFPPSGVGAASDVGFCLTRTGADGVQSQRCFTWDGCEVDPGRIAPPALPTLATWGQLLTGPIDGGVDRCRWHRVELDADLPPGTTVQVSVATSERPDPPPQGDAAIEAGDWDRLLAGVPHGALPAIPPGVPHPADWQRAGAGATDFLVRQPPGRYLFVRLRLVGTGTTTPVVRRVRLEFERVTSLELLPPVYRENPDAEDFTERFLSLFDRSVEELDAAIVRAPALLDAAGAPDELLPWLAAFFDIAFEAGWSPARRRTILRAAPSLYRRRGTVAGLRATIAAVFGAEPAIEEMPAQRLWAGMGFGSVVGGTRLFGAARARLRLGASALSASTIRSYGDPSRDALQAEAFRFRVSMPAGVLPGPDGAARLQRLVDTQKPAHTIASTRTGGSGFLVGRWSAVGVDTGFASLPPPVLGASGNVRLRRMSVLWPGAHADGGVVVGGARVGITMVTE